MNGAQALIAALVADGVDVAFMNPGTSEMHFVSALDQVPAMRGVLALFEGVATGAADGYARMADRPAATLLHLGPGLGNGLANLHNARRGHTPLVNIVGDHATYHKAYDPQLESDIETVARNVSAFVRRSQGPEDVVADAHDAVIAALGPPGQVATLILPADASWLEVADSGDATTWAGAAGPPAPAEPAVDVDRVEAAAQVLRSGQPVALLVGGRVVRGPALRDAAAVSAATGARFLCETFPARLERGAGVPPVERLGYLAEFAAAQLDGLAHLVLVDAASPVSFFAYPGKASDLVPPGCQVHELAGPGDDAAATLVALLDALDAPRAAPGGRPRRDPTRPRAP